MENEQNEAPKTLPGKKELRHQLADKMQTALPELREMLGEKKFASRIKKAARLLLEGLHKEDVAKKAKKATATKNAQKAAAKQTAVKKAATKTAKAAPAKKAKAAKKSSGK